MPTDNEYSHQVQAHLIEYYRLFSDVPGVSFGEEDIVYIACQAFPDNQVMRTNFTDANVSRRISETLARIGQITDSVDWLVFPSCQPPDLGIQLTIHAAAAGDWQLVGKLGGPGGIWMIADLASLTESPRHSSDFHVRRVRDDTQLNDWLAVNAKGFGSGDYEVIHDAFARYGFGPNADLVHYIGYLNNDPVTSATLFLAGGIASIWNVSTPAALRRKGFGGAITYAVFQEAQKRGYRMAFILSSELGKGVYSKLGFAVTDFGIREYRWRKR